MAAEDLTAPGRPPGDSPHRYVDVWGDTVDARHLKWAILIGITISFVAFASSNAILSRFIHDVAMARAYAMLVGLGGCLVAGAICARLFKPKRIAVALAADEARRAQLVAKLVAAQGARHATQRGKRALSNAAGGAAEGSDHDAAKQYGGVASLPPHVIAEMREVGLYDLFDAQERIAVRDAAGSGGDDTTTPRTDASSPVGIERYTHGEAFR